MHASEQNPGWCKTFKCGSTKTKRKWYNKNVNPVSLSPVFTAQAGQIHHVWSSSDGKRTGSLLEVSAKATVTALFVEKNKI